jgi:hypothetical protein
MPVHLNLDFVALALFRFGGHIGQTVKVKYLSGPPIISQINRVPYSAWCVGPHGVISPAVASREKCFPFVSDALDFLFGPVLEKVEVTGCQIVDDKGPEAIFWSERLGKWQSVEHDTISPRTIEDCPPIRERFVIYFHVDENQVGLNTDRKWIVGLRSDRRGRVNKCA